MPTLTCITAGERCWKTLVKRSQPARSGSDECIPRPPCKHSPSLHCMGNGTLVKLKANIFQRWILELLLWKAFYENPVTQLSPSQDYLGKLWMEFLLFCSVMNIRTVLVPLRITMLCIIMGLSKTYLFIRMVLFWITLEITADGPYLPGAETEVEDAVHWRIVHWIMN